MLLIMLNSQNLFNISFSNAKPALLNGGNYQLDYGEK